MTALAGGLCLMNVDATNDLVVFLTERVVDSSGMEFYAHYYRKTIRELQRIVLVSTSGCVPEHGRGDCRQGHDPCFRGVAADAVSLHGWLG